MAESKISMPSNWKIRVSMRILFCLLFSLNSLLAFAQKPLPFYNEYVPAKYARKEARKKMTFYYVYQEDCSYCHDFSRKLNALNKEKKWLKKNATLLAKNAQNPANAEWLIKHQVTTTPTVLWVNHNENKSFVYENVQNPKILFMSILKSMKDKKYDAFFENYWSDNFCAIDSFARSVYTHYFIANDSLNAIQSMKTCQLWHRNNRIISDIYLENMDYTLSTVSDEEGHYVYEYLPLFLQHPQADAQETALRNFVHRSLEKSLKDADSLHYHKAIMLEYALSNDQSDSTFLSRRFYFALKHRNLADARYFSNQLYSMFRQNDALLSLYAKDLFNALPEARDEVLKLSAAALFLNPLPEYRTQYAERLRFYGYNSDAKMLE